MPIALSPAVGDNPRGDLDLILRLRWLTLAAMLAALVLAPLALELSLPWLPMLAVALLVALVNGLTLIWRRVGGAPPLVAQLGFDLLAWSLFIFCSGGATNPLISILLPLVAIGAARLPERQAWALGLLAVMAYSGLWQFHWPLSIANEALAIRLHLAGMWLTFFVSVGVTVWFVARMTAAVRDRDQALAAAREQSLRHDWVLSLGSLAAGTAHELSTPMATLAMLVDERRADPQLAPDLREDLDLMAVQVQACKQSLTRLAIRAGQARADQRLQCRADDWLKDLVQGWRALYPATELSLTLDPGLAHIYLAPDLSLEQALRNLVDNGVAASPAQIELHAGQLDEMLEIRVSDRGPGITAQVASALGQPQSSQAGMGIGLALTLGTLERYGGGLDLIPQPQGGTQARVWLPLERLRLP